MCRHVAFSVGFFWHTGHPLVVPGQVLNYVRGQGYQEPGRRARVLQQVSAGRLRRQLLEASVMKPLPEERPRFACPKPGALTFF